MRSNLQVAHLLYATFFDYSVREIGEGAMALHRRAQKYGALFRVSAERLSCFANS